MSAIRLLAARLPWLVQIAAAIPLLIARACGPCDAVALDSRIKVVVANGPVSQPTSYHELTSLIAPRPLLVGQAVGERRPEEEEIHASVSQVYRALGYGERVLYVWYAGDHDYPPEMRKAAVDWFRRWFNADEGRRPNWRHAARVACGDKDERRGGRPPSVAEHFSEVGYVRGFFSEVGSQVGFHD